MTLLSRKDIYALAWALLASWTVWTAAVVLAIATILRSDWTDDDELWSIINEELGFAFVGFTIILTYIVPAVLACVTLSGERVRKEAGALAVDTVIRASGGLTLRLVTLIFAASGVVELQ